MEINIYRNIAIQATFETGEQTVFKHQLMGEHKIEARFTSYSVLPIQLGDYIKHKGENFYINQVPAVVKRSNAAYEYAINFEGEIYRLYNKIFMHEGAAEFDYFGDAESLLTLIVNNINATDSGWTKGAIADTESKLFRFENDTCRTALTKIADEFQLEFSLAAREISLVKAVGHDTNLLFEYGKGKGLYQLTRNAIDDKNVVTRVYAFGGDKNLGADYRDGAKKLVFEDRYLESNINLYGIIEGVVNFPNIYPHRTGTVTATAEINKIIDSGIDFNINNFLLEGLVATIVFKTGDLAGSEFEITNYNHITKEIRFNPITEANDYQLPNDTFKPAVGDTYTLVNIKMPETYQEAAEDELEGATRDWLAENDHPRVSYALNIDRFHAEDEGIELHIGDKVQAKDVPLNVDSTIRAIGISYPLIDPFRITATIADFVAYTAQEKAIARGIDTAKEVVQVDRTRTEASRRNAMRYKQLQSLIFDPDGNLQPGLITAETIQALMAVIGTDSMDFHLSGVMISPNYLGNPNNLDLSAGQLVHNVYEIEGLGSIWDMTAATFDDLDPAKAYYVYAKCSKSQLSGTWEISETQVHTNDTPGFWAFNLGILYNVADGYRDFDFTNGQTRIIGDNITTGRIKDLSGQNYFDLNSGKFNLGDINSGIDWDVTKPGRLTIRGGITANAGGVTQPLGVYRGQYDAETVYYPGDTLTHDGSLWLVIAAGSITGITPVEGANYTLQVQKGQTGLGVNVRVIYRKNDDADNAPDIDANNPDPPGWSLQMPPIDTYWLLATEEGDFISTIDGDQYLTSVDGEYIWATTEVLDGNGAFDHWSDPARISGRNGIPTEYTEYRFQKNGSPTNSPAVDKIDPMPAFWTIPMPKIQPGTEYLWMIKANKLPDGTLVSAWSDPVRTSPVDGGTVAQGDPGPFMMFRGAWKADKQYVGNSSRIEAVSYNNAHYVTRVDAGDIPLGTLPTDSDFWNEFVGEFESVATNLLLAEIAYIENLGVNWLRTQEYGNRIELRGVEDENNPGAHDDNTLIFFDENNNQILRIDDNLDYEIGDGYPGNLQTKAGIRVYHPASGRTAYMTGNGFFSNASGVRFLSAVFGIETNASVVGLLFDRNNDPNGISAAVVGIDQTSKGSSESWGGFFSSLKVAGKVEIGEIILTGLNLKPLRITTAGTYNLGTAETIVNAYHTSGTVTLNLPTGDNLTEGRTFLFRKVNSSKTVLNGNGQQILSSSGGGKASFDLKTRYVYVATWDGAYWNLVGIP